MATITTMQFVAYRLRVRACYDSLTDDGYVMLQLADRVFPCGDLYEPEGAALFVYANWREFQELVAACIISGDETAWSGWHTPTLAVQPCRAGPAAPVRYRLSDANRDALELSRDELGHLLRVYFIVAGLALVLQMPQMRHGGTRALRFRHEINARSLFLFGSARLLVAFSVVDRLSAFVHVGDTRRLLLDAAECDELTDFDRSMRCDWQYDFTREYVYALRDGETTLCICQSPSRELTSNELHLHYEDWQLLLQCVHAYLALHRYVARLADAYCGGATFELVHETPAYTSHQPLPNGLAARTTTLAAPGPHAQAAAWC